MVEFRADNSNTVTLGLYSTELHFPIRYRLEQPAPLINYFLNGFLLHS